MDQQLANRISELCLRHFDQLKKTGKPKVGEEWTVLSAIVELNGKSNNLKVVTMGSGTKCLNSLQLSSKGDVINDSHAEVMARRGFLRYLLDDMVMQQSFKFNATTNYFDLDENLSFHFFTTHAPCGDASIFNFGDTEEANTKKLKIVSDFDNYGAAVGFTGAKLLTITKAGDDDLMAQCESQVRTKPGKGVRTLSVSCSDKLARWNVMGVQGAMLLTLLSRPIYFDSVVICDGTSINVGALRRAIWERWDYTAATIDQRFKVNRPNIFVADNKIYFKFAKTKLVCEKDATTQPCPSSMSWSCVDESKR
jgi:tRNA-specific adenosine deaminase 1